MLKAHTIALPAAAPSAEPAKPTAAPSYRNTARMRARVAPIARRMPISRVRCTTLTASTLAIPKATDSPTKKRISALDSDCERSAFSNCALVLIQLSDFSPVSAAMRVEMCCASKMSRTVRSISVAPPGSASSD